MVFNTHRTGITVDWTPKKLTEIGKKLVIDRYIDIIDRYIDIFLVSNVQYSLHFSIYLLLAIKCTGDWLSVQILNISQQPHTTHSHTLHTASLYIKVFSSFVTGKQFSIHFQLLSTVMIRA